MDDAETTEHRAGEQSTAPAGEGCRPDDLGSLIRESRRCAGLTQYQLAREADLSIGVIRDLEQGITRRPRLGSLRRLASVLWMNADEAAAIATVTPRERHATVAAAEIAVIPTVRAQDRGATGLLLQVLGPHLRGLVSREPFDEAAQARLMIALAGSGQQAAALAIYDQVRLRLDAELGIRPGAELDRAQGQVLRQQVRPASHAPDRALKWPGTAARSSMTIWQALATFPWPGSGTKRRLSQTKGIGRRSGVTNHENNPPVGSLRIGTDRAAGGIGLLTPEMAIAALASVAVFCPGCGPRLVLAAG